MRAAGSSWSRSWGWAASAWRRSCSRSVALPFLTSPELCECGLREHEIMAREVVINTLFGVQLWLVVGALVLAAPGVLLAGSLGADAGMPPAWRWLSS